LAKIISLNEQPIDEYYSLAKITWGLLREDGTLKLKNGETRAFCDVYEFSGAKGTSVKEITSYAIETK
jgi:hypothetical protein